MIQKLKRECTRAQWKMPLLWADEDIWAIFAYAAPLWLVEEKFLKFSKAKVKNEKVMELLLGRLLSFESVYLEKSLLKKYAYISVSGTDETVVKKAKEMLAKKETGYPCYVINKQNRLIGIAAYKDCLIAGVVNRPCSAEHLEQAQKINQTTCLTQIDAKVLKIVLGKVQEMQRKANLSPLIDGKYRLVDGIFDAGKGEITDDAFCKKVLANEKIFVIGKY